MSFRFRLDADEATMPTQHTRHGSLHIIYAEQRVRGDRACILQLRWDSGILCGIGSIATCTDGSQELQWFRHRVLSESRERNKERLVLRPSTVDTHFHYHVHMLLAVRTLEIASAVACNCLVTHIEDVALTVVDKELPLALSACIRTNICNRQWSFMSMHLIGSRWITASWSHRIWATFELHARWAFFLSTK